MTFLPLLTEGKGGGGSDLACRLAWRGDQKNDKMMGRVPSKNENKNVCFEAQFRRRRRCVVCFCFPLTTHGNVSLITPRGHTTNTSTKKTVEGQTCIVHIENMRRTCRGKSFSTTNQNQQPHVEIKNEGGKFVFSFLSVCRTQRKAFVFEGESEILLTGRFLSGGLFSVMRNCCRHKHQRDDHEQRKVKKEKCVLKSK